MALPLEKAPPQPRLSDQTILIYGEPKTGKSTFVSGFPDVLFFLFHDTLKGLKAYKNRIWEWEEFVKDIDTLEADYALPPNDRRFPYRAIAVDTLDYAYQLCVEYMGNLKGFEYQSDLSDGKGWTLVKLEYLKQLKRLINLPPTTIFICHSRYKKIETAKGKRHKIVPNLIGSIRDEFNGLVNAIFYVEVEDTVDGPKHQLRTKSTSLYDAGAHAGSELEDPCPLNFDEFLLEWNSAIVHFEDESEGK